MVYSVESPSSFKSIESHLELIESCTPTDLIKVICGHKCDDLKSFDSKKVEEIVSIYETKHFLTSTKDSLKHTINNLFEEIVCMIRDKYENKSDF